MSERLAMIKECEVMRLRDSNFLSMSILVNYEYEGFQDILGGRCLHNNHLKTQSSYGCRVISDVLNALDVNIPSDAVGKIIFVIGEGEGFNFEPKGFKTLRVYGEQKKVLFDIRPEEKINLGEVK
jgi:hypothetical protein